jgi:hypothetical protein
LLYYLFLLFIGYFIYSFQIEKSFALLTIYFLCISFSFFSFITNISSKILLPYLFVVSLFAMYGVRNSDGIVHVDVQQFLILLSVFTLFLFTLIVDYNLKIKKWLVFLYGVILSLIYLEKADWLSEYKFIPYVIGSFFMFRSISYLHEVKFMKKEILLIDRINYFLLVPNFSLPLFPIIDYKIFTSCFEGINSKTLSRGTLLIARGVFQMMLFRYIYHELIIPYDQIHTALQTLTFIVANFLIILRVIGAFHIAIGLIIIFGYNLPAIFNNIFFSTGFSNLWRRTNMYWRNFIIKIFYYPIYFRIKNIGIYPALFISTFVCFFITWMLHNYQWFWLKGFFPIETKDLIFWGVFGLLVAVNTLIQQRKLDRETVKAPTAFGFLRQAVAGLLVLLTMSVLWSIWTCNSLTYWWRLISNLKNIDLLQLRVILFMVLGYIFVAAIYHSYENPANRKLNFIRHNKNAFAFSAFIILLLGLKVSGNITLRNNSMFFRTRLEPILTEQLNKADLKMIDNGYYTNLITTNNYCSQVWINDNDISRNWTKYITSKTTRQSFDLYLTKNIPHAKVAHKGITYTLNSYGLRDKEYSAIKPDSCYRIIILGGSYECGNGMNDGEDFISEVENKLNENYNATIKGKRVRIELINFSSNGYRLIQRFYQYKENARMWKPDAVLLFIHTNYRMRIINYMNRLIYQDFPVTDPYLKHIIEVSQIRKGDLEPVVKEKLAPYGDSLNFYAVNEISKMTHEDNTRLIAVYLPAIRQNSLLRDSIFTATICKNYDMQLINLSGVYSGYAVEELALSDVDFHPNKMANDLIAEKLLNEIIDKQNYFNLQFTKK